MKSGTPGFTFRSSWRHCCAMRRSRPAPSASSRAGTPTYIPDVGRRSSTASAQSHSRCSSRIRWSTFLKRAALLHTDTVRFISGDSAYASGDVSMLMPQRVMVETEDGRQRSLLTGAVHWEFARVLLDQVDDVSQDAFVRDWYRATMRHKLGRDDLDALHFEHALAAVPERCRHPFSGRVPARVAGRS